MSTIIEIFATLTDVIFLAFFIPAFLGVSLKRKKWTIIFPTIYFIAQLLFDVCLPGFELLPMAALIILAFSFAVSLCKQRIAWCIFTSCLFTIVTMLVSTLLFSVFSIYLPDPEVLLQGSKTSVRILIILIGKVTLFACLQLLTKLFSKEKNIVNFNAVLMLGLSFGTASGLSVLMKIAAVIETENANPEILILSIILVGINILFYVLISQNQKLQKHKYELQLTKERIESYEKHAEEVAIVWDNIKRVRHDLNNHFIYLQAQLELGNVDKCKTYLSEMQSEITSMGSLIKTGNSVIDYMINVKLSRVSQTQVLVSGNVGEFADIKDADMTCVLGNILDNAIEALENVESDRRLELHFTGTKNCRIILCKNTVSASVLDGNGDLTTTKTDKDFHGLGHMIVEDIVQKYGGFTDYFESDGMFGVQLSFPVIEA